MVCNNLGNYLSIQSTVLFENGHHDHFSLLLFQYFAGGAGAEGEIAKFLEKNKTIVKLGYAFSVPSFRTKVDQYIMRNTDLGRCYNRDRILTAQSVLH